MKESIAICINSLRIGGTERVVSILLDHLRNDFHIHLVLYNDEIGFEIPAGVKVFKLSQPAAESSAAMLVKGPFLSYKLHRYCKKNSITTAIGFLNRGCYMVALLRKLFRYSGKVVMCQRTHQSTLTAHGSFLYRIFSNLLLKWSFSAADLVLANSFEIEKDLEKYVRPNTPVLVIHNPMNLAEIKHLAGEHVALARPDGSFRFVALGGLRPEKDHEMLLEAFSNLTTKGTKLWIIGGGELETRLKRKALDLHISGALEFFGRISNPFPFLSAADCLVLSSRVEGFPNALLEGLACGKPVISTDCMSGPREILAPGTSAPKNLTAAEFAEFGILVPVHNAGQMTRAMQEMMDNDTLREAYAEKAADRIRSFDVMLLKKLFINAFSSSEACPHIA